MLPNKLRVVTVWLFVLLTLTATCNHADVGGREDLEAELARLKAAYEKGLIPEDIYREKVRTLLGILNTAPPRLTQPSSPGSGRHPVQGTRTRRSAKLPLTGIWYVGTSNLGIFSPSYARNKFLGFVTWKLILSGSHLKVLKYTPAPETGFFTGSNPARYPYEEMKVKEVAIDPNGNWITFRIDRSVDAIEAWEAFELNDITQDEITGTYKIYDRYGSGPGTGPEYSGLIRLVRYDEP